MPSNYFYSKKGVSCRLYNNMKTNSKRRGHDLPSYDLSEFRHWLASQYKFHELYVGWVNSGYNSNKAVSVDRIDNNKGYEFNNIRLMSWKDNNRLANKDMRAGRLINGVNPQKSVEQYTFCGKLLNDYPSLREASRITGIDRKKISDVCYEKKVSVDGYIFKFKQL